MAKDKGRKSNSFGDKPKTAKKGPDCYKCKHFFVTWDVQLPKGCKAYEIKSHGLPKDLVLRLSGTPCGLFVPKEKKEK